MKSRPSMVWLPADHRLLGDHGFAMPYLLLGDKYARAVKVGAQAQPVMFPLADTGQISELLALVDGVMLTGSPSNVHPSHFDEAVADPSLPLDADRDLLTLALVKACVHQGVPLLGICRGFQEINVALGGTLHQRVHEVPGMMDHREPKPAPPDEQYAPRHGVRFAPGSVFEQWAGGPEAQVNSLHGQGIARLAEGLEPLARIASYATAGLDPSIMGVGPIHASRKALDKAGWKVGDLDLVEANEAFAAQACAVNKDMGWDPAIVNVNGGAIAIGHPIGASGCRVLNTLIHEMGRRNAKKGLATLCIGGGMGVALTLER